MMGGIARAVVPVVVMVAMVVAIPVGLASAIYLSEYAPPRVRRLLKPALEILAGIARSLKRAVEN